MTERWRWYPCWYCGEPVCVADGMALVCWRRACDAQLDAAMARWRERWL